MYARHARSNHSTEVSQTASQVLLTGAPELERRKFADWCYSRKGDQTEIGMY